MDSKPQHVIIGLLKWKDGWWTNDNPRHRCTTSPTYIPLYELDAKK